MTHYKDDDIAVIGLAGLFPGSQTLDEFWNNLLQNRDCRSVAGKNQMGREPAPFVGKPGEDDSFYCIHGGYINDFKLNPDEIGLSAQRIEQLDDVYQWSLYVVRESLRDSGYLNKTKNIATGVILGNLSFPTKQSNQLFIPLYHQALNHGLVENLGDDNLVLPRFTPAQAVSAEAGLLAGYPSALIAEAFDLSAACFCLDAACASSLYAVKLACDYLNAGRADMMLAGAVSAADPFFVNLGFSVFHAYPENNISAPLDKRSQGLFAGEGAGMVVLKRLSDALADNDTIHAVIKGGGLSNDGKGQHVLSPNTKGQVKAFERAYESAQLDPASVHYVECHATGTPLGDKVELTSMETFFTPYLKQSKQKAPLVGSVKSNLGHLLTAAGMPAMTKVILSMKHGVIPASINIENKQHSPQQIFSANEICSENTLWQDERKRAGVSVFGFGGANAHMVFEAPPTQKQKKIRNPKPNAGQVSMAIVGMDAHFGSCENLAEFECMLLEDKHLFRPLPEKRWKGLEQESFIQGAFHDQIPQGAYLESFDLDFLNFKLPPHIDERLIPQQLLLMKVVDRALHDAKLEKGGKVAVLVAMGTELELHQIRARVNLNAQFEELWSSQGKAFSDTQKQSIELETKNSIHHKAQLNQYTSAIGNIMASRIASLWDFSGPAFTVSAEENSAFCALELAQLMLHNNEVDAVVVAAVDLSASVESLLLRQQSGSIHKQGNSLSFDQENQGWSVGEGAGAIVLKSLEKVGESRVYANIDALAFDTLGKGKGLQGATEAALFNCAYDFEDLSYLELCASGFSQLDAQEETALLKLATNSDKTKTLAIGSVKNNIGHTFAASGIASLIKTALCLHNRSLPSTSSWSLAKQNQTQWQDSSLYIPVQTKTWFRNASQGARCAGVNSLALDGRCAFVALSESQQTATRENQFIYQSEGQLFTLRGNHIQELISELEVFAQEGKAAHSLADFASAYFHQHQSRTGKLCLSLVINRKEQIESEVNLAKAGLTALLKNSASQDSGKQEWFSPSGSYFTSKPLGKKGKVSFVYPGAFNSYLNVAKDLGQLFPELHGLFAKHSEEAATLFADELYYPRKIEKLSNEQEKLLQKALPEQAISSFENGISVAVGFTEIFNTILGVKADLAYGYSMGEVSMMYALGVWGTTDAMSKRLRTNPVFQTRLAGSMDTLREAWNLGKDVADGSFWTGFALLAPVELIRQAIEHEPFVRLILINTANEAVIAGKPQDCRRVAESLGCDYFEAALGDVIHCDWVRPEYEQLAALHILDVVQTDAVKFFTAVGNKALTISSQGVANNIAEMYCNPVDFVALTEKVYEEGARIFIELGARDNCTRHISQILASREHVCIPANRKGASDKANLLRALARLAAHGVAFKQARLYQPVAQQDKKTLMVKIEVGGTPIQRHLKKLKSIATPKIASVKKVIDVVPAAKTVTLPTNKNLAPASKNVSVIPHTILQGFHENVARVNLAHEAFLESRKQNLKILGDLLANQLASGKAYSGKPSLSVVKSESVSEQNNTRSRFDQSRVQYPHANLDTVVWGPEALREFAEGNIAKVFGEQYAIIDSYSRRVRLPTTEYLLVDRVTQLDAKVHCFEPCSMTTEYDVPYDFWYSVKGQIPWAVAVESGQCDLLLISFLGIDFLNKGERVYRLLDCELTFMDNVAMEGDTLRYEIKINSYARSGDGFLFFFEYDCFVGDKLVLTMRNGAAGFFSDEELDAGKGVIHTEAEKAARAKIQKQTFNALLACSKRSFSYQDMLALCEGDLTACFGNPAFAHRGLNPNLVYSAPKMLMIERITEVDPKGGAYGLGVLIGEKTLHPEHWYFPCHFKDDQVMAGSLMSDGCSQLLRFYTWYLGLHTLTENAVFQPLPGLGQKVRCRGQVTPQHGTLIYKMEITEIGTQPYPYAKANVDIILNGKIVVDFKNLGLFLGEIAGTEMEAKIRRRERVLAGDYSNRLEFSAQLQSSHKKAMQAESARQNSNVLHEGHVYVPGRYEIRQHPFKPFAGNAFDNNAVPDTVPYTQWHFLEFATGRIANCFGEEFGSIYDGRTPPRTPNADLQLTTRVLQVEGKRADLKSVASTLAEFDCPADAWFFRENTHPELMPYSMIMEISLQPNGFISAWVGTTLLFPERDLYFRNLDGSGTLLKHIDLRGKTIQNRSTLLSTTSAGNTIIQSFKYDLSVNGEVFYEGTSVFGYFLKEALTHQLGLDNGKIARPWHEEHQVDASLLTPMDLLSPDARARFYQAKTGKPYYRLANPQLDLIERVVLSNTAGEFNQGYVYAEKTINPNDWFFPCHFHQDPVMPGSLGVEAILQAMQVWALDNDLGAQFSNPRFVHELSTVKWKYRGQIIPDNKTMSLDVHISKVDLRADKVVIFAKASLYKDGLRIYEVSDAQIALCEA